MQSIPGRRLLDRDCSKNHDPLGDSLIRADISVHSDFRYKGLATMLYNARKELAIKMNLRRVIAGGRLYDYYKYAKMNVS